MTGSPELGRLIGIARRDAVRAPMQEIAAGVITVDGGLEGDHKGPKFPRRRITVLAREAWEEALADLPPVDGAPVRLPWTTRRANLFVEGVRLPRARGGILRVGPVKLEVTYPTQPCRRMEEAYTGLLKALHPDWRGGVTCQVLEGGAIAIGDEVEVLLSPPEHVMRLP
ncbi:MAG TPA: MOSC domain-containing protein [Hyphomicrobium sp.]|nr:MOSC domain-containing protein [Hyphomicrobium sp.]